MGQCAVSCKPGVGSDSSSVPHTPDVENLPPFPSTSAQDPNSFKGLPMSQCSSAAQNLTTLLKLRRAAKLKKVVPEDSDKESKIVLPRFVQIRIKKSERSSRAKLLSIRSVEGRRNQGGIEEKVCTQLTEKEDSKNEDKCSGFSPIVRPRCSSILRHRDTSSPISKRATKTVTFCELKTLIEPFKTSTGVGSCRKVQLEDGEDLLVCCSISSHGVPLDAIGMGANVSSNSNGNDLHPIEKSVKNRLNDYEKISYVNFQSDPAILHPVPDQNRNYTSTQKSCEQLKSRNQKLRQNFFSSIDEPRKQENNEENQREMKRSNKTDLGYRSMTASASNKITSRMNRNVSAGRCIDPSEKRNQIPKLYSVNNEPLNQNKNSEPKPHSNIKSNSSPSRTGKWSGKHSNVITENKGQTTPNFRQPQSTQSNLPLPVISANTKYHSKLPQPIPAPVSCLAYNKEVLRSAPSKVGLGYYSSRIPSLSTSPGTKIGSFKDQSTPRRRELAQPLQTKPFYTIFTKPWHQPVDTVNRCSNAVMTRKFEAQGSVPLATSSRSECKVLERDSKENKCPGQTSRLIRSNTWTKKTGEHIEANVAVECEDFSEMKNTSAHERCFSGRESSIASETSSADTENTPSCQRRSGHNSDQNVISDSEFLIDDEISDQPELTLTFKGQDSSQLSPSTSGESLLSCDLNLVDAKSLKGGEKLNQNSSYIESDSAISDGSSSTKPSTEPDDHSFHSSRKEIELNSDDNKGIVLFHEGGKDCKNSKFHYTQVKRSSRNLHEISTFSHEAKKKSPVIVDRNKGSVGVNKSPKSKSKLISSAFEAGAKSHKTPVKSQMGVTTPRTTRTSPLKGSSLVESPRTSPLKASSAAAAESPRRNSGVATFELHNSSNKSAEKNLKVEKSSPRRSSLVTNEKASNHNESEGCKAIFERRKMSEELFDLRERKKEGADCMNAWNMPSELLEEIQDLKTSLNFLQGVLEDKVKADKDRDALINKLMDELQKCYKCHNCGSRNLSNQELEEEIETFKSKKNVADNCVESFKASQGKDCSEKNVMSNNKLHGNPNGKMSPHRHAYKAGPSEKSGIAVRKHRNQIPYYSKT